MPTYEFRCDTCGHEFERNQKMSDPNPPCPHETVFTDPRGNPVYEVGHGDKPMARTCGGPTTKLISHTSFVLEGGGWAADGYGSGKH